MLMLMVVVMMTTTWFFFNHRNMFLSIMIPKKNVNQTQSTKATNTSNKNFVNIQNPSFCLTIKGPKTIKDHQRPSKTIQGPKAGASFQPLAWKQVAPRGLTFWIWIPWIARRLGFSLTPSRLNFFLGGVVFPLKKTKTRKFKLFY